MVMGNSSAHCRGLKNGRGAQGRGGEECRALSMKSKQMGAKMVKQASDDDDDDDEDQGAYLLNGSVPLQSPLHMLHPWSPGELKRKNKTHIIVSRH